MAKPVMMEHVWRDLNRNNPRMRWEAWPSYLCFSAARCNISTWLAHRGVESSILAWRWHLSVEAVGVLWAASEWYVEILA